MRRNNINIFLMVLTSFVVGGLAGQYYPPKKSLLISKINIWDNNNAEDWNEAFSIVKIRSSVDDTEQSAYFLKAGSGGPKPLVVSLHSWSGDYSQKDALAPMLKDAGWNYIHPNFRGPNWTQDACLSEKAIADIEDAIQYAIDNGIVDMKNIFVVGVSGGGYATLGTYLSTRHSVRSFYSWAPISDLSAWYHQLSNRKSKYAKDILKCTSDSTALDEKEARLRSPLFWDVPKKPKGRLEIYAGINDGFTGSVPISHSILFYNHIAKHLGRQNNLVEQNELIALLTRGVNGSNELGSLGKRKIYYRRDIDSLSLVIFDGGHEMLPKYCFERMRMLAEQDSPRDKQSLNPWNSTER